MNRLMYNLHGITEGKYREARRMRKSMTEAERLLWERLRRNQIDGFHFRRQHVILGFIVDFYCIKAKPAIEVDGGIPTVNQERDLTRDEILASKEIMASGFSNNQCINRWMKWFGQFCTYADKEKRSEKNVDRANLSSPPSP
jgi:very-short-patch-repair endonuclease